MEIKLKFLEETIEKLRELTKAQCSSGNYDYDDYMHGMANGMILALSMLDGVEPEFLDAPKEWKAHNKNAILMAAMCVWYREFPDSFESQGFEVPEDESDRAVVKFFLDFATKTGDIEKDEHSLSVNQALIEG